MRGDFQEVVKLRPGLKTGLFLIVFGAFFGGPPLAVTLSSDEVPAFVYLFPTVGFILGAIGLRMLSSIRGLDVDSHAEILKVWHQVGWKREEELVPFADLKLVRLAKRVIRTRNSNGSSSTKTIYPVDIQDRSGHFIDVITCNASTKARAHAEKVAAALKLTLQDVTTGITVTRDHDKLDETVGARLLREGAEIELTTPPQVQGLEFDTTQDQGIISLPKLGVAGMIPAVILLLFGGVFLAIVLGVSGGDVTVAVFMGGPIALFSGAIIWNALFPRVIEIGADEIKVRQVGFLGRKLGSIKVAELEELHLVSGNVLCRSDTGDVAIKLNSSEQAAWVRQVLEYILLQMEKSKR